MPPTATPSTTLPAAAIPLTATPSAVTPYFTRQRRLPFPSSGTPRCDAVHRVAVTHRGLPNAAEHQATCPSDAPRTDTVPRMVVADQSRPPRRRPRSWPWMPPPPKKYHRRRQPWPRRRRARGSWRAPLALPGASHGAAKAAQSARSPLRGRCDAAKTRRPARSSCSPWRGRRSGGKGAEQAGDGSVFV